MAVVCGVLVGCSPDASIPKTQVQSPVRWEYAVFEWHDMEFDSANHPDEVLATFIHFQNDALWETAWGKGGQEIGTLDALLNRIGAHGWELVCFDGRNYIVKCPANQNADSQNDFEIDRHWKTLKSN